jgi:hypothetical protein
MLHTQSRILAFLTSASLLVSVGCTKPKETTAVGSAAGTALGAGLGAIIGNQTGNAGSGVAIGAVAGAATGALVANALQAQQESVRSQDEAIERQERLLQAQRSELNELRTMNSDVVEKKRIALQKRGPNPMATYRTASARSTEWLPTTTDNTMRARMNPTLDSGKPSRTSALSAKTTSVKTQSNRGAAALPSKSVAPSIAPKLVNDEASSDSDGSDAVTAEKLAGLATESDSEACHDASKEQRAATKATDSSDKLFHLRKALRLCPANAELHHALGKVYASMNRTTDAKQAFAEALKADPTFGAAKSSLNNLTEQSEGRF